MRTAIPFIVAGFFCVSINAAPINLGFEAGDLSGWNVTLVPTDGTTTGPFATDSVLPPSPQFPAPVGDFQLYYLHRAGASNSTTNQLLMNQAWAQDVDQILTLFYLAAFNLPQSGNTGATLHFKLRENPGDPFFEDTLIDITHAQNGGTGFISFSDDADFIQVEVPLRTGFPYLFEVDIHVEGSSNSLWLAMDTQLIPEPSSLTLAALGMLGVLAYGWRRRRRA